MGKTPYSDLPDHAFWSKAHQVDDMREIDPVVSAGFELTPDMKIATAGSCFAQHIARHLRAEGYNYLVTEKAHPLLTEGIAQEHGYGVFTARFGNIYTARQLLQLVRRAYREFTPLEQCWEREDGTLIDPFRPNIQPGGFLSRGEFDEQRALHFAAIRKMIETADVFVFTLGLTEAWKDKRDGAIFPVVPGAAGGTFDPGKYEFVNFEVDRVVSDFESFVSFMRARNPRVRILLTVSPVPLVATARADCSVITSTCYSKAVLRVAAERLERQLENCFYFPSYEVITSSFSRGEYYADDFRTVREAGVAHVMSLFMRHYTRSTPPAKERGADDAAERARRFTAEVEKDLDVICDEELLVPREP
ncbi:GSCFA domain-containing protein [Vannielia litorea]|uniref:GSCFA domain-containing protein n=1 Tax=Vannielia litorea TaxID=1217970 RepID=UPI001C943C48|nr:GSCFA domain-containing protein [Vannielia litorea]MBY6049520.1 GSCFA domain-containing protein [Vannielia litorea]MBY6076934.1 GSCFA domain-containing protein [Vannielia litorea]